MTQRVLGDLVAAGTRIRVLAGRWSLVAALIALAGCAARPGVQAEPTPPIKIEAVRLTAAGHYVDLRYRVLDAARANELLGPGVKPVLIDEANGATMGVPMTAKLGPLRQTQATQRPDHLYFVMFLNSAGLTPGSKVTAQLGGITLANLTVE